MVSYRKASVLPLVIESAASGSLVPDLVVVADDGSDDGTPDAAEAACRKHGIPCRILRHPRVAIYRIQAMRNSAVAAALEGVVLLSDSDCILGRYTLEAHSLIHRKFQDAMGTGARFEYLAGTSGEFTSMYSTLEFSHCSSGNYMVPYGANMSFTKRMWRRLGGFDRSYDLHYGFEDHEFMFRAEQASAVIYADPAAYMFHCPHPTVFGHRDASVNIARFDRSFGRDYVREHLAFLRTMVLPQYWRGQRKESLLGPGRLSLDRWGAPPGYRPPLHLALVEDMTPINTAVRRFLADMDEERRQELCRLVRSVDHQRLLPFSVAEALILNLRWILDSFDIENESRRSEMHYWVDRWIRWEAALRAGDPRIQHAPAAHTTPTRTA